MKEHALNPADRIIVALDCDAQKALRIADALVDKATWLKVGMTLFYQEGPGIVEVLKAMGFKVFVDLKLHDIPHQVQGAAYALARYGADMISVHTSGGRAMMEAACAGVQAAQKDKNMQGSSTQDYCAILGITVLTSMDVSALASVGVTDPMSVQVKRLALLAQDAGLDGVVASALEAGMLRETLDGEALIVTPGVRSAGESASDQSRVATPAQALQAGADYLVIGRQITESTDPAHAFDVILKEVKDLGRSKILRYAQNDTQRSE